MSRIALLAAPVSWSGVEVHTVHLACGLKNRGHDVVIVELFTRGYVNTPLTLPCPVMQLDLKSFTSKKRSLDSLRFWEWLRVFVSIKADVAVGVKGVFKFGSLGMEIAARLCFGHFLVIEHLHMPLTERPKVRSHKGLITGPGLWRYRQRYSGHLRSIFPQKIICVSRALSSSLEKNYYYPPSKLVVAHGGVDTMLFAPDHNLREQAREAWRIPKNAFVFGTVGRISPMKNHAQLIKAFSRLCQDAGSRDLRLVIIGDGALRNYLYDLARLSGLSGKIFFGGFSKSPEKVYQGFDLFCLPSTGEAFGLSLLEAMSCGCPAVASAVGGVPEILSDPGLGWLVRPGDENALLAAMRSAVELEYEKIKWMGAKARAHVIRNFNASERFDELAKVIESVV